MYKICQKFAEKACMVDDLDTVESWESVVDAFRAAEEGIPQKKVVPNKPWISEATLDLIEQHLAARVSKVIRLGERIRVLEVTAAAVL